MKKTNHFHRPIAGLIVLALLVLSWIGNGIYAKYIYKEELSGTVTITANLGTIAVEEHEAVRQPDGSYELGSKIVDQNEYILMPGVDIKKDPYVTITNKSSIGAYVFIVVDSTLPSEVTYTLADHWEAVEGFDNVYVYADANGQPIVVTNTTDGIENISILAPIAVDSTCTLEVSQKVAHSLSAHLNFSACMGQVTADDQTAEEVYGKFFSTNT